MNIAQYHFLTAACDDLLRTPDATIERICIPWLHIVREHPVFLSDYCDLFESDKSGMAGIRSLERSLLRSATNFRQIVRALLSDGQLWYGPEKLPDTIDYLFVSHLLNEFQAGSKDDFYFGELADELVARGHSAVICLINHTGRSALSLVPRWGKRAVPRLVLSSHIPLIEEMVLYRRLKHESRRLKVLAQHESDKLAQRILFRASDEALSGGARTSLRMAVQIESLTTRLKPRIIVTTHEGHAWERIVFASARRVSPRVFCIGYQHAALFRHQHAIKRALSREFNPDYILAAGEVTQQQLRKAPDLQGIPVDVLGSGRGLTELHSHANSLDRYNKKLSQGKGEPACLVIPEGIAGECDILFNFSMDCARILPHIRFVWRLHPVISFEALMKKNKKLQRLPANVEMSRMPIEHDMDRCRWALYRGTTAIMQAVLAGLRPMYLSLQDELSIDPLYELNSFRTIIKSPEELAQALQGDINGQACQQPSEYQEAYDYCRRYFLPWNAEILENAVLYDEK